MEEEDDGEVWSAQLQLKRLKILYGEHEKRKTRNEQRSDLYRIAARVAGGIIAALTFYATLRQVLFP